MRLVEMRIGRGDWEIWAFLAPTFTRAAADRVAVELLGSLIEEHGKAAVRIDGRRIRPARQLEPAGIAG